MQPPHPESALAAASATSGAAWRGWAWLWRLGVGAAILAALVAVCEPAEMARAWRRADARLWLACLVPLHAAVGAGAAALVVLLPRSGRGVRRGAFLAEYVEAQALSLLTPAQAGEAVLVLRSRALGLLPGEVAAALLVQRLTALSVIAGVLIVLPAVCLPASAGAALSAAAVLVAAAVVVLAVGARLRHWASQWVGRRFGPVLDGFVVSLAAIARAGRWRLAMHAGLMTVRYFATVAASWLLFASFGVRVPFMVLAIVLAVVNIAGLVPITMNGLGVTEAIGVATLGQLGHAEADVLTACLVGRAIHLGMMLAWLPAAWWMRRERSE